MPEESRRALNRLDPRAPLVIDTRELARRPGAMRVLSRTVPAPSDLGIDMLGVPEGADLELECRLESVMEGVLVSGTAQAPLAGECVRCLERLESDLDVEFQELFVYPGHDAVDEETLCVEGDMLDLDPVVRDAVVLALPFQPVCRDDCPGLCSACGARLADDPGHRHEAIDPRWAALEGLAEGAAGGRPAEARDDGDDEER
ncbi:MAG: YceD family protein [Carbonactinosporaceae bacterium]